ncbi:MAG: helix-turn-helix domain-containing protein [Thiobacillus sp.]|jgi:hypothetical protein|uniref:helix-turn-helix domain-containing protein n=1 Tax=Thiobacillus sp. TaxID=924 RepID=UPI0028945C1E|nr:helix-turn-helix domain-containing protein [Thiobacillus sp.]MDT3707467.1 helix-turn-helix domain-containing protein [Thiobacillus sp.]
MSKPGDQVDFVLDRMVEVVLGENAQFRSHAEALGIPANTIKTWKRRGEVPSGYLKGFADDWKVSFDWLLHGGARQAVQVESHKVSEAERPYGISAEEWRLIERYRRSRPEIRAAALRVLGDPSAPAATEESRRIPKPDRIVVRSGDLPARKFKPPEPPSPATRKKKGDAA